MSSRRPSRFFGFEALRRYAEPAGAPGERPPKDWRLFNEGIGLPVHPDTRTPGKLLSYQDDIGTCRHKELVVNKSNKIGVTEAVLREGAWQGTVGDCVGYQMALGAQDYPLAIRNLRRLTRLFRQSPLLSPLVRWDRSNQKVLETLDGTYYFVLPRNAPAGRGWDLLKWVFGDAAAHHGLMDDSDYPLALESRLANTDGYSRWVSTPHGQRGFFWRKAVEAKAGRTDAKYLELPYHVGVGRLFTQDFVERMKTRMSPAEFSQELECAFISAQNAAIEPALLDRNVGDFPADNW